jgi:hypothetical protein
MRAVIARSYADTAKRASTNAGGAGTSYVYQGNRSLCVVLDNGTR